MFLVQLITLPVKQNDLLQELAKTVTHNFFLFSIDSVGNSRRSPRLVNAYHC